LAPGIDRLRHQNRLNNHRRKARPAYRAFEQTVNHQGLFTAIANFILALDVALLQNIS
jgi:hypothetical protein